MKKYLIIILLLLAAGSAYSINAKVKPQWVPPFQPTRDGDKSVFEKGILYRRAGCVPQLQITGSHYEMGKQYGVLLSSEIKYTADSLERMLVTVAQNKHIPTWFVRFYVKQKAGGIARRLPRRFLDEMRGMAEGCGIPYDQILMVNMIYDIFRLKGCTSILAKGPAGEIFHGHTTDIGWGNDWPETILVQYRPTGYHNFTSITWAGFSGTQSAYNCHGLCYSEDTLCAKWKNPKGFSVNFLARMIMEECKSLEETIPFFDKYNTINGEALVLSDIKNGAGRIVETTPAAPVRWADTPLKENMLWGINQYLNREMAEDLQDNLEADNGFNSGRTRILNHFLANNHLKNSLDQVVAILRSSVGPDGKDYAKNAYQEGICNASTQQMLIYDPKGTGLYLATGPYYASRNDIWYYPGNFTDPPFHYRDPTPLDPVLKESGQLLNSIISWNDSYSGWSRLAQKYPNKAFLQIYAGRAALRMGNMEFWSERMQQAYRLEPDFPEHRIEAAMAGYYQKNYRQAIELLKPVNIETLSSRYYKALYLALLTKSYRMIDENELERLYNDKLRTYLTENKPLKKWLKKYLKRYTRHI